MSKLWKPNEKQLQENVKNKKIKKGLIFKFYFTIILALSLLEV